MSDETQTNHTIAFIFYVFPIKFPWSPIIWYNFLWFHIKWGTYRSYGSKNHIKCCTYPSYGSKLASRVECTSKWKEIRFNSLVLESIRISWFIIHQNIVSFVNIFSTFSRYYWSVSWQIWTLFQDSYGLLSANIICPCS